MLLVFDGITEQLATVCLNNGGEALPYYEPIYKEQLNQDYTFEFNVPANHSDSQYITKGNIVAFLDLDGTLQAFTIYKTEELHSGTEVSIKAYAEHIMFEMIDDIVTDLRVAGGTVTDAMPKALNGSRWQVGQVDDSGATANINFYYTTCLANLRDVVNTYGGELRYRVEYDEANKTLGNRYVDLLFRRGADTGRRFEYTKDIGSVKRTVDASNLKTALYGRGKATEYDTGGYSRKADFTDIVWSVANGDPVDKPAGQDWVGDPNALALYGRANGTRHRMGVQEFSEIEDPATLLQATWDYLQTVNKPLLTYELTAVDLERLTGLGFEAVRLGDTVFVIDYEFKPAIIVEARVIELERNLNNITATKITLGNFIPLFTDIEARLDQVEQKLTNSGIWDKAGTASTVTDDSFPDNVPPAPTNVKATGFFETISVTWDYDPSSYISRYEVYASKVQGFTVDATNLVWGGKAGGFVHRVLPNEVWYYRIRAVNTHGTASAYSGEVSGSTARLNGTNYIAEATIGDALIKDVSADKLTAGEIDANTVNIINLNADNITGGLVKAQYVEIGGTSTFETGYDPTKIQVGVRNLFITSTATGELLASDGSITTDETYRLSDFIAVVGGKEYTFSKYDISGTIRIAQYDSTQTFVSYYETTADTYTMEIGNGIAFIRVCVEASLNCQVESGNKSTDFKPAPEDVDNEINNVYNTVTEEYHTAISTTQDQIMSDVSVEIDDAKGDMQSYTDSKITQTEDDFNIKFTQVDNTTSDHEDRLNTVYEYFDFSPTGLNIGRSDDPLQINISNSEMDFLDNGTVVAYINGQKMYIDSLEVITSVIVGNHKVEKYDNNITLVKWVGG